MHFNIVIQQINWDSSDRNTTDSGQWNWFLSLCLHPRHFWISSNLLFNLYCGFLQVKKKAADMLQKWKDLPKSFTSLCLNKKQFLLYEAVRAAVTLLIFNQELLEKWNNFWGCFVVSSPSSSERWHNTLKLELKSSIPVLPNYSYIIILVFN